MRFDWKLKMNVYDKNGIPLEIGDFVRNDKNIIGKVLKIPNESLIQIFWFSLLTMSLWMKTNNLEKLSDEEVMLWILEQ